MTQDDRVELRELLEEKLKGLEEKLNAQNREMDLRFGSLDKALMLAREDAKAKYEHLNALRTEVTTDRGMFVNKEQCLRMHKDLGTWMDTVNKRLNVSETRSITWTAAVGIFFVVITLV